MKRQFNNDPRQLQVKWACNCSTCGAKLPKGVNAYYWPSSRKMYCLSCGDADFRQFLSSVEDEENYNHSYQSYC
jgi:hypothetical protein